MKRSYIALVILLNGFMGSFAFAHPVGKKFEATLACKNDSQDLLRPFCAVHENPQSGWSKAEKFMPPSTTTSYVGIGVFVPNAVENLRTLLLQQTHPVVLHMSPSGAKIQTLQGSNEQEKQELADVVIQVSVALKKKPLKNISISTGMATYFAGERQKPLHPFGMVKGTGGTLRDVKLDTTLEEVSLDNGLHVYLVYEQGRDGVYVSIFPKLLLTTKIQ